MVLLTEIPLEKKDSILHSSIEKVLYYTPVYRKVLYKILVYRKDSIYTYRLVCIKLQRVNVPWKRCCTHCKTMLHIK